MTYPLPCLAHQSLSILHTPQPQQSRGSLAGSPPSPRVRAMKKKPAPPGTVVERPAAARWSIRWALTSGAEFVWKTLALPCLLKTLSGQLDQLAGAFLRRHARRLAGTVTITVAEHDGGGEGTTMKQRSEAYEQAKAYLSHRCSLGARALLAAGGDRGVVLGLVDGEEVSDEFRGATVWWSSVVPAPRRDDNNRHDAGGGRTYRLVFHHRHRDLVGRAIIVANRRRKLFTNAKGLVWGWGSSVWSHVALEHPSTFDTLAMDPARKKEIMDDLDAFRAGKDYYARVGKAWKRGYLLYGPPGTGKSSMIAAMANYLDYHIYDIELTSVSTNTDLRRMFIETMSKSIIVIEDIDCSLDLTGKRGTTTDATKKKKTKTKTKKKSDKDGSGTTSAARKLTLSGVLNFIDGLWSACGGERIIVFTTNHVDKLDPALIRSGRMDKHIVMSYCCFESFKFLARNYLDVDAHHLFDAVAALLKEVDITPADVAELLTPKQRAAAGEDADSCLAALVEALQKAKEEEAAKRKAKEEAVQANKAGEKKGKEEVVEVADDVGAGDGDGSVLLQEDVVAELMTPKCADDDEGRSCLDGPVEMLPEAKETAMAAAKNAISDKEVVKDY
ncbi:hypothetical protein HU200_013662 [Digitaria exilis]|uniref:AAA+ ATPase domain-containing protein n=1 Tax=Digitaria exilis TaxID=1010633 RepID=A0A835FCW5_9POAL|nr:hypothetical protein HU200_013662 [Digitaria exilis]